jgi:hypothetical protein
LRDSLKALSPPGFGRGERGIDHFYMYYI